MASGGGVFGGLGESVFSRRSALHVAPGCRGNEAGREGGQQGELEGGRDSGAKQFS